MKRLSFSIGEKWPVAAARLAHPYGLVIILIIFAGLALLYDFSVPLFEKPDELKHFAVIQFIQTRHQLPVVQAGLYQPWDQEGTQPPLYHLLAAAVMSWLNLDNFQEPPRNPHYVDERSFIWREWGNNNLYLHDLGEEWSMSPVFVAARLARWVSLLAGLGTIYLTYLLGRVVFADYLVAGQLGKSENKGLAFWNWLPLLAAMLVAFIPQFLHTSSAITNDSLSVTLAAAALVLLALVIKHGSSPRYTMYLGLVLGLAAITKLSLLYLTPLTGLVFLYDLYRHRSWRSLLVNGVIVGGLLLLVAGWWYGRNWQLYGDPTALNAHLLYRGGPLHPTPTLIQLWQTEITGLELSFWAAFGAGQILFESWLYEVLKWGKYIIFGGILIGLWGIFKYWILAARLHKVRDGDDTRAMCIYSTPHLILLLLLLWSLIIFVALLRWMQITPASWGRLLYPALPSLGVLSAWGLAQFGLLLRNTSYRAARFGNALSLFLPLLFVMVLFWLSLISPFCYTWATYAKAPLISEADISKEDIAPLDLVYDDTLRLIGYRVEKSAVRPGEWLPVTLYWQATRPVAQNYSVFVHLLGNNHAVVGQVNTYPDHGNWPTSLLPPGKVLKDTYYIPVSPNAEAPAVLRLALGIFAFEDPQRTAKKVVNRGGEAVEPIVGAIPLLPHQWPDLKPAYPLEANFANQIRLLGYDWPADAPLKPGDVVSLTFYWETLAPPGQDLTLFIHLLNVTGTQIAGFDAPPSFPTGFWQAKNTLIDARSLALPTDLPAGDYKLVIGWYNPATQTRLPLTDNEKGDNLTLFVISVRER